MSRARVARNSLYSVMQVAASAACLVVTYWLMMRWLSMAEIGLWSLIVGTSMVARLSELGLGGGVLRFVAGDLEAGDRRGAARTIGMAALAVLLLVSALAFALQPILQSYLSRLVPTALQGAVDALLPAALVGIVLGAVGNVFTSALDGAQRMGLRAAIQIGGSAAQLLLTTVLLPRFGLSGLGWVQVGQAVVVLIGGAAAVRLAIDQPVNSYMGFDRVRLRALVAYGGGLQISALAQLLFEPLVKVLLTTFSGLTLTGYFDVSNRIVLQFRSLIVAAYGAIVPHVAAHSGNQAVDPEQVRRIYRESFTILLFALFPYFSVVAAALPLALTVWKGAFDPVFVLVALLLVGTWTVNLVSLPAYLIFVGLGRLQWTIVSHVLIAVVTAVLGALGGYWFGGTAILFAATAAIAAGSALVLGAFVREFALPLLPERAAPLLRGLALLASAVAASAAAATNSASWPVLMALPLVTGAAAIAVLWTDPARPATIAVLASLRHS